MGRPVLHRKVKLIIGFIFGDEKNLKKSELLVSRKYGPIDFESRILDFAHTDYYHKELGRDLKRKFISLRRLVAPENIYRIKLATNDMERKLSRSGKRTVNIDPGYVTLGKLVLLTTKDNSHRVYLKKGIYAESTLKFLEGAYLPRETAYPDYKSVDYIEIFNKIRKLYKTQLADYA